MNTARPYFLQALDALKVGGRRAAARLLERQLHERNNSAGNLANIHQLAAHIGEIELAIEASRLAIVPGFAESLLAYWGTLASYGRASEALASEQEQPEAVRGHPAVLHFRGSVATQLGRFEEAEELFRGALAKAPTMTATWLSLAMIKQFRSSDPDLAAMEHLERASTGSTAAARAPLHYAIGKAREECGDIDRAFQHYSQGAALRRRQAAFDLNRYREDSETVIRELTPERLRRLVPSRFEGSRSLFVTGLPRSGTTLTEQVVLGHSVVGDGAEINLFAPALLPTLGVGFASALDYERRSQSPDPWGDIARDYSRFIDMRFRRPGLTVDKSLGQAQLVGFILHALPDARIAWVRRSPEDVALSCFRTFFATGLNWTCSLEDIADYMRIEDRLFGHWRSIFEDRILPVPYEELVAVPGQWAERLQHHFGLPFEPAIERAMPDRPIGTASAKQAREPISTQRIGQAISFDRHLEPFRRRYYA